MTTVFSYLKRFAYPLVLLAVAFFVTQYASGQAPIGLYGNQGYTTFSAGTGTSVTVSAFQTVGVLTGAPTGNATYTLDTAANLCNLFPQLANTATLGFTYDWTVINTSNFPIAIAAGTGDTISSQWETAVPPQSQRRFKISLANCSAGAQAATITGGATAPEIQEAYGSAVVTGPVATGAIPIATFGNGAFSGIMSSIPTAAETLTTDTAANLCKATPVAGVAATGGFFTDWYIKDASAGAFTITMAGGTGVTLVGTGTAAQNFVRHLRYVFTNCAVGSEAVSLVSLETTAF